MATIRQHFFYSILGLQWQRRQAGPSPGVLADRPCRVRSGPTSATVSVGRLGADREVTAGLWPPYSSILSVRGNRKTFCLCGLGRRAAFAKKTYVNGIDPNYPPFAYVDEKIGQPAGFDVDSMTWIAKHMGLK